MPWRNWKWTGEMICYCGNQANNLTYDRVQITVITTDEVLALRYDLWINL